MELSNWGRRYRRKLGRAEFGDRSDAERALEVYRTAGSSAYIARDTIERFRGTSTSDIVKGVAGVTTLSNGQIVLILDMKELLDGASERRGVSRAALLAAAE